jgi:hypothetical protein
MQHDIYALGVVLLEIGLWTSFAVEDSECDSNLPTPSNILDSVKLDLLYPLSVAAEKKQRLEYLAAHELPPRLGRRYADIVLLCLQYLDAEDGKGESEKLSSPWTDQDGVVIGVRIHGERAYENARNHDLVVVERRLSTVNGRLSNDLFGDGRTGSDIHITSSSIWTRRQE